MTPLILYMLQMLGTLDIKNRG